MKKIMLQIILSVFLLTGVAQSASFIQKTGLVIQNSVTATSGGVTTLVATSNQVQIFNGTQNHTVTLPDAVQLFGGWFYDIVNQSTGTLTVEDSDQTDLFILKGGEWVRVWLSSNAASTGNWRGKIQTEEENTDHGALLGLGDDDHPQYYNEARGDARYYRKNEFINSFSGLAFEPITTDADGLIDSNLLPAGSGGGGGVSGPTESVDNSVARFNGITGAIIQGSNIIVDDDGDMSGVRDIDATGDLVVLGELDVTNGPVFLASPAATPNSVLLGNSQITVSLDETNSTIEFLAKDSGGTTFSKSLSGPGGSDTNVQFNDGGAFGGESAFTYNKTTNQVGVEEITASGGGSGSNSERFGASVSGTGGDQTLLGNGIIAGSNSGVVAIGYDVFVGGTYTAPQNTIAIGRQARTLGAAGTIAIGASADALDGGIAIGREVVCNDSSVCIGTSAAATDASVGRNIVLGDSAQITGGANSNLLIAPTGSITSGNNQAVFGSETAPYNNFYLGEGITSTTPSDVTIRGTTGSGTDIAAGDVYLAGGRSTGNADPGEIYFQTTDAGSTGTTAQTLSTKAKIDDSFQVVEQTAPATPASGFMALYAKTDGNFYAKNDAGTEYQITPPGGGGGWTPDTSQSVTATGIGTFTVPSGVTKLAVLVVAGGGGGGNYVTGLEAGGGGAGGSTNYTDNYPVYPGQVIKYYLGAGGIGDTGNAAGTGGENTIFGNFMAQGGAGGSGSSSAGTTGGNQGGGTRVQNPGSAFTYSALTNVAVNSINGYFNGGSASGAPAYPGSTVAGGGAGAGGDGQDADVTGPVYSSGDGGIGYSFVNPITSATVEYGCGGGGAAYLGPNAGLAGVAGCSTGGYGGGPSTLNPSGVAASSGTANFGGGGGGGANSYASGNGGSGFIQIFWDAP